VGLAEFVFTAVNTQASHSHGRCGSASAKTARSLPGGVDVVDITSSEAYGGGGSIGWRGTGKCVARSVAAIRFSFRRHDLPAVARIGACFQGIGLDRTFPAA
jgi:hypothetical protein